MCLAKCGLFPVINPWRMAAGYPSLFLIDPFHSSSSWLRHSTLRPHLVYTDTMRETQLERERIKFLICPCFLFQTGLSPSLSLPRSPPLSSSNLSSGTREGTPLISPRLSFFRLLTSSSVALNVWQALSQRLRKFLILPRSRLVKTHTATAQLVLNFPTAAFFFWHLCPFSFFYKNLRAGESRQGKNSIHPVLREQAETLEGRWWKKELPLYISSSSTRNL